MAAMADLDALVALVTTAPGLLGKRDLEVVQRLDAGIDGDDAALVAHGDGFIVICGEAISPPFLLADPFGAGSAAVVTNVSDVRAMGARALGVVDMLVSPDKAHAEAVLDGLKWASDRLGVPILGGHLTLGHAPALSASCTGFTKAPLRATAAKPGDVLLAAFAIDGRYMSDANDFFTALQGPPPEPAQDRRRGARRGRRAPALPRRPRHLDARRGRLAAADDRGRGRRRHARRRRDPAPDRRRAGALAADVPELRLPARRARATTSTRPCDVFLRARPGLRAVRALR